MVELSFLFLYLNVTNEYTLKDSFEFAKDRTNQNSKCFIASLDVESLFNDIHLDETIKFCNDELFKSKMTVSGLNKKKIFEMLFVNFKRSCLITNIKVILTELP